MSISKPRLKSAVIRQNDKLKGTNNTTTTTTTTTTAQILETNFQNKGSPKNGQNNKILPLSTNLTNAIGKTYKTLQNSCSTTVTTAAAVAAAVAVTSTTTTTTILPQTNLLKIEPFVPSLNTRLQQKTIRRSYSTLTSSSTTTSTSLKKLQQQQQQQYANRSKVNNLAGNTNIVSGLPKVLKQPNNNTTLRRRPTLRGNINRQRSKSTSSSNSNSNRPTTAAVTVISTPSLGTPCSSPYSATAPLVIQQPNGICRIQRHVKEQEKLPDRINYDKRGLTAIPIFENETNLRLLSLQHNLINTFHIPKEQDSSSTNSNNETKKKELQLEERMDNKSDMETINLLGTNNNSINNYSYGIQSGKQRFPLALTTPNVEQLQPPTSATTQLQLLNSNNTMRQFEGFTTYASLQQQHQQQQQQQRLMQRPNNFQIQTSNLTAKNMSPSNQLRFVGIRKSHSFINNFNLQINLNKRSVQNHRMAYLKRTQQVQGNLKSFDSSTSNLTTDSTHSTLLTNEMEDQMENQQGEEEDANSLTGMEIKNKQLIIDYGKIFESLVFLDLYDNQIEKVANLDGLPNLTVLLLGKNRISDITGLASLKSSLRVLDLHGNKICSITNKINCLKELKSLNLAGNQIRQINHNDFLSLNNLKELNLKRNKLKRINGFQHLICLERLWLCHNDLHKVDDMSTIAKALNLIEITIENNPLTLAGDCVSFLVSYLPKLQTLSQMPITEQVRKAAMSWRANKELSEAHTTNLSNKEVFNIIRREEIISNARTNWELLRSQQMVQTSLKQQKLHKTGNELERITETNEQTYEEFIKLPPIEQQQQQGGRGGAGGGEENDKEERSSSASSLGPNVNSSSSCYSSQDEEDCSDKISTKKNKRCNDKYSTNSMKVKQETDNNLNQTSNDNNNHHHQQHSNSQQSKCNTTRTSTSSSAATMTTSNCAPTLNLQFPMENNKVSSNQQNQAVISNATSVSSSSCLTLQTAAAAVVSLSNSPSSVASVVTQASTYSKRYMTGSLMRSQTIVGTVTGATPSTAAAGMGSNVGSCGGGGITNGYMAKTNTVTTANNIRYQSKLNLNTDTAQTSALATHQQTMTTTMMTTTTTTGAGTGNIAITTPATAPATNSNNNLMSSSMHGHNMSLTLNSNKTSSSTTTATIAGNTAAGVSAIATTGPCGATTMKLTAIEREREQGGDYLIEICGRYLNIYGQGALRFIDKQWNPTKANDVHTLNFSYINFNNIASILGRIKVRFPHAENFVFRETNINSLGQLNALAELQGISSLTIDIEGNPITHKDLWRQYAIYRLSHWGLKMLNSTEVTEAEIEKSNSIYTGLSDLILWSMPDAMLQPLLTRLRLDESCTASKMLPKQWLQKPDNKSLRLVVGKEALQWKKINNQEQHHHQQQQLPTPQQVRQLQNQYYYNNVDYTNTNQQQQHNSTSIAVASAAAAAVAGTSSSSMLSSSTSTTSLTTRERGKIHFTLMMENTCNAVEKLHKLEQLWPTMLLNTVRNTILDYSQLDVYIRNLMDEIMK